MTVSALTLASLRAAKNAVIGNPLAKIQLVRDEVFISQLIHCLNTQNPDASSPVSKAAHDMRVEAAHVIASLSYGSEEALGTLLRGNALHALIYALSHFSPADSLTLRAAFSRALRALTSSLADVAGPSLWGLRAESGIIRNDAQQALEYLFQIETMDVYMPLLVPSVSTTFSASPTAVLTSTAQMLAGSMRIPVHRRAVTEWLPPTDRQKEVKSRRGWEKTSSLSGNAAFPWVARQLVSLLREKERDIKLIEAVLLALSALAKENAFVANYLEKPFQEGPPPLVSIVNYTKSRSIDVQLAACLCITHALRASSSSAHALTPPHPHLSPSPGHAAGSLSAQPSLHSSSSVNLPALHDTCTRTVMNVFNRIVATPSPSDFSTSSADSPQTKTKACFILHYLVTDDISLCHAALDRGCLEHIGTVIKCVTPAEPAPPEWEEDEPECKAQLREAALTCLASLALCSDDIRRRVTDELRLLPCISRALRAKRHVGTRYAACQCVRAVSRAVSVLRTGIVDSGLGMDVLRIVLGKGLGDRFGGSVSSVSSANNGSSRIIEGKQKENIGSDDYVMDVMDGPTAKARQRNLGEDTRVLSAALSAVCNIVNDFSPLRPIYLEENLMPRLVYILKESGDPALRLNALWAVKNLVRKSSTETKRNLMSHLGWQDLLNYLSDSEPDIQEQAFNILRNLSENEEGIAMVFRELPQVLGKLVEGMRSSNEDVVLQSTFVLANLANGTHEQQDLIIKYPGLLSTLQMCLAESTAAVRRPAVSCVLALAQANPKRRKEMGEAGIVGTLKRLCEWSGHASAHPQSSHGHSSSSIAGGVSATPSIPSSVGFGYTGWGTRSPVRSSVGSNAGGIYGSWSGSGSLHHHHSSHSRQGHGLMGAGEHTGGGTSHQPPSLLVVLDDERDVVQRARNALEWLEHAETYAVP